MGALYKLDFTSGKSYVGITAGLALSRFKGHAIAAKQGSTLAVHSAWRKYGVPVLTVLAILRREDLLNAERRAVHVFGTISPNGYNMTPGGESNPMLIPELAAKVSATMMGHKVTDETRAKLSKVMAGRKASSDTRAKLSASHRGKPLSAEHIEKLRGRIVSAETRAKISVIHKGKTISEEHKVRLRGRHVSSETRAKQSVAQKRRRARQLFRGDV